MMVDNKSMESIDIEVSPFQHLSELGPTASSSSSQPPDSQGSRATSVGELPPHEADDVLSALETDLTRRLSLVSHLSMSSSNSISATVNEAYGAANVQDLARKSGTLVYVDQKDIKKLKTLGQGAYAAVHLAEYTRPDIPVPERSTTPPLTVAVKQLKSNPCGRVDGDVMDLIQEAALSSQLQHENIISVLAIGSDTTDANANTDEEWRHMFVVQEYATGGTLKSLLLKQMANYQKPLYSFQDALRWAINIASALDYMHSRSPTVIHRDLKSDNILLTGKPGHLIAKIADFGLHACVEKTDQSNSRGPSSYLLTGKTGSFCYMAPEVLMNKPYNESVDCFSFGILLYELFSKQALAAKYSNAADRDDTEDFAFKVAAGFRCEMPKYVNTRVAKLIDRCWASTPELRPPMSQVLAELEQIAESGAINEMDAALNQTRIKNKKHGKCIVM